MQTSIYQMPLLHKEFTPPLNVVIIVKTHLRTQARAPIILSSSDVALAYTLRVDYQNRAEDHTCKGVGECHPYREFEGMQPSR